MARPLRSFVSPVLFGAVAAVLVVAVVFLVVALVDSLVHPTLKHLDAGAFVLLSVILLPACAAAVRRFLQTLAEH